MWHKMVSCAWRLRRPRLQRSRMFVAPRHPISSRLQRSRMFVAPPASHLLPAPAEPNVCSPSWRSWRRLQQMRSPVRAARSRSARSAGRPDPASQELFLGSTPGIPSPHGATLPIPISRASGQLAQVFSQLWRHAAPDKRIARFPVGRGCKVYQQRRAAALKDGDGLAVPEQNPV